jgi:hypothetical protein
MDSDCSESEQRDGGLVDDEKNEVGDSNASHSQHGSDNDDEESGDSNECGAQGGSVEDDHESWDSEEFDPEYGSVEDDKEPRNTNELDSEHGSVDDDNESGNSGRSITGNRDIHASQNSVFFESDLLSSDPDDDSCPTSSSSSSSSSGLFEEDSLDELLDDTFDQELILLLLLAKEQRNFKWHQKKLPWDEHVAKLHHERQFSRTYRMSHEAFCNLKKILLPFLVPNCTRWNQSNNDEIIYPELVMAIGLRWVAGGSYIDIRHAYFCSVASVYRCRDIFMNAVLKANELNIVFPSTPEEQKRVAEGFQKKSSNGVHTGCIGAIDGLLAEIKCPSMQESENHPKSYFSGHYGCHGLNVQAVCDSKCRFIFFAVAAPGKTPDQTAFERTSLYELIQNLPPGIYIVADAAYTLCEGVLVPFTGSQRDDPVKDSFNFHLSQLRIRIEMAFGLFTNKFQILRKAFTTKMAITARTLQACARLHNFVIDQDRDEEDLETDALEDEIVPLAESPLQWGYLPTVEKLDPPGGTSQTREAILGKLTREGLRRPAANVERRRKELQDMGLM